MRLATLDDIDGIAEVVRSNNTMYGVDISDRHDKIIDYYHTCISGLSEENDAADTSVFCYELDNKLVGIVIQRFWKMMPIWSSTLHFIHYNVWSTNMFTKNIQICGEMSDYMLLNAESRQYYDYVLIIRGDGVEKRNKHLTEKFRTQYHHNVWKIIEPYQDTGSPLYDRMLAFIKGKNRKTLMVRHCSMKQEYRMAYK